MPSVYKIIRKESELDELIKYCKQTGYCSFDFETSGQPEHSSMGYPTILGVSFQPGSSWIIPLGHFDSPFKIDGPDRKQPWLKMLRKFSKEVLEDRDVIKVAWNFKFEYKWLKKYKCKVFGRVFDGMLAKYLLNEERPNDLKSQVAKYLPEFGGYEEDYEGSKLPWDRKPLEGLSKYCGLDTDMTLRLMIFFERQLISNKFYSLFRNMLMMASFVLGDSEYDGMPVDKTYLEGLIHKYQELLKESEDKLRSNKFIKKFQMWQTEQRLDKLINKIELEIEELEEEAKSLKDRTAKARKLKSINTREQKIDRLRAKDFNDTNAEKALFEPINFSSPSQMGELFFTSPKGFRFKIIKYTTDKFKNETNNPSTDEEVLTELAKTDKTGFCQELLNYRGLTKMYGAFVIGMYNRLSENSSIHGRFNLHQTVTGRLSSNDPNLQQIPRDTTSSDIKKMFVPPKGYLLLQLDYSQAELRVLAAQAGEKTMIRWFKEGKDIHLASALKKYGMEDQYDRIAELLDKEDGSEEYITWKKRRKQAKTINFGIVYGQGANMLSVSLECSVEEAKQFLKDFDKTFPRIAKFIKKQHQYALDNAYVKNVFGRKRRLWDVDSDNPVLVAQALRQSVNAPIQGAASDYTLFSSILIWEQSIYYQLEHKGLKVEQLKIQDSKLIKIYKPQAYTVHDSLGFWVKPEDIHDVVPRLLEICNNPETLEWFGFQIDDVTMKVDFEVSEKSWGDLKTYRKEIDYVKVLKEYNQVA